MALPSGEAKQLQTQQTFVRADEVDAGTTILSTGTQKPLSALSPADGVSTSTSRPKPPPRPSLRREGTAPPPPPPSVPPPAPPPSNPTDSLSLPQLKQLVNQFPKTEQRAYAYQYRDAEDYATEIDEWFRYTEVEQDREYLLTARDLFEQRWKVFSQTKLGQDDAPWTDIDHKYRRNFVSTLAYDLQGQSPGLRQEALATAYYILAGVWSVTAGLGPGPITDDEDEEEDKPERYSAVQIEWMREGARLITDCGVTKLIYKCLRNVLGSPSNKSKPQPENLGEYTTDNEHDREVLLCLSCLYLIAEAARDMSNSEVGHKIRQELVNTKPNMLVYLVGVLSRLRWDESYHIPSVHVLQLLWKLILVFFGDTKTHLSVIKGILQPRVEPFSAEASHPILTASPLDYHMFRQEVTSKYPSYNPPPPLIPLELEQKSMLPPPLQNSKLESYDNFSGQGGIIAGGGSILHQPVHIATPAPSPPPSPAAGGKAGKKQNYQTNQNFPFLYPPLDSASNNIGGRGTTEFQDKMVGKKWEGSDIPASIIEAGELFASRMRMTRAMRQLWHERDVFMKFERGWDGGGREYGVVRNQNNSIPKQMDDDDNKLEDTDLQERLQAVEEFFHLALPDLQSLIIVMMKIMLANAQDIAVRNGGGQEHQPNSLNRTKSNPNMTQNQGLPLPPPPPRPNEMTLDDLDNVRTREVSQKAISGAIFLLLKWFKTSHILKFEYMTQLLLDSNYIQLTLKYFAHQNLEDLVPFNYDRDDLSFWHYCHLHCDHPPLSPTSPDSHPHSDSDSIDEAVPPPIQRHRRSPTTNSEGASNPNSINNATSMGITLTQSPEQTISQHQSSYPTVDELGNPLAPLPTTPIKDFSRRQFQTSIHLLRILQKLTRSKSHRILLLVQFKSSQILRRVLRVPDPFLRLYVLKLFKSQVPYCGRKWRQSNMRVITAIYLHCRPELRDDWLAGMHDTNVEGEVDEAVPLEWALRGLTFWWMKRNYPDVMQQKKVQNERNGKPKPGVPASAATDRNHDEDSKKGKNVDDNPNTEEGGQEIEDDERDFFQQELDAMGWGMAAMNLGDDVGFGEEAPGVMSAVPNGANGDHHMGWEGSMQNSGQGVDGRGGGGSGGMEMW